MTQQNMRQILMFNRVTIEGYFSGSDGDYRALAVPDKDLDKESAERTPGTDTFLFGRRTYEIMESFWPHALDNPDLPPAMRAMATTLNESAKLVFSRTLKEVKWKNSKLYREFDPVEIQNLKRQPGKDMMILGSGSIVSQLTQHGLIDEFQFIVSPIMLGRGQSLMTGVSNNTSLELKEAKGYPSGNVMLRYVRRSEALPTAEHFRSER